MIILLFICCYISGVTLFVLVGAYRLRKQYIKNVPQTLIKKQVVTKTITRKEIQKQYKERKTLRDNSYEAVLNRCKDASTAGEVVYFSLEDLEGIVKELQKERME